jgi:hypothetical protein
MRPGLIRGLMLGSVLAAGAIHAGPGLKDAAALYHRGRYDSALSVLDAFRPEMQRRRDSLSLFQYSGMASARLGRAERAVAEFRVLLGLDSLFQFPRNEDSAILEAFAKAQASRKGKTGAAASNAPAGDSASPARLASAGGGSAGILTVRANPAAEAWVPIPAYPGSQFPGAEPPANAREGGLDRGPRRSGIGLAMGAVPLGGGWLSEGRYKPGLALAFLQIGGIALSLYASSRITAEEKDLYGIKDDRELGIVHKWQWTQGLALSTALGAYLYSLMASRKD